MTGEWTSIVLRLGVAVALGLLLGWDRERHGHQAGLRTHAMVALSSAMITLSALQIADGARGPGMTSDPVRVVQGLAQAIGFIAGGLIFVRNGDAHNITTATSLWMAAAIGIAAGAGQFALVTIGAGAALLLMVGLRVMKKDD